jgi:hypothetical protein
LSRGLKRYYGRLRLPPGSPPTSRLSTGYRARRSDTFRSRRAGEGLPSSRRHLPNVPRPILREVPRGRTSRLFAPSMAFTRTSTSSAPPFHPKGRVLTTRRASLHAADRSVAPPEGLLTLGSDPTCFQTEPPACYQASWQLPGRDSHPLATTSLRWIRSPHSTTSNPGRTKNSTYNRRSHSVSTVQKSHSTIALACWRRNSRQLMLARLGAGATPAPRRMFHTLLADRWKPSPTNSPWRRR